MVGFFCRSKKSPFESPSAVACLLKTPAWNTYPLLVAPLFAGEKERDVIFPKGRWFDFYSGAAIETTGGRLRVRRSDQRIPLFVRDGGQNATTPTRLHAPGPDETLPLEIRVYGRSDSTRSFYDDDGESFAYERGEFSWLRSRVSFHKEELQPITATNGARAFGYEPITHRAMTRPE